MIHQLNVENTEETFAAGAWSAQYLLYNIWLIFGISAAIITCALSYVDFVVKKDISTPIVGGVFICVAMYEIIFLLSDNNFTRISSNAAGDTYFSWFVSRLLHSILLTCSIWYFISIEKKNIRSLDQKKKSLSALLVIFMLILSAAIAFTYYYQRAGILDYPESFITHPYEFVVLAIYLIQAFWFLPRFLIRFPSLFTRMMVLSIIPAAFAQLFMAIYHQPYDSYFNAAYFLRFINYLIPLLGISMNYIDTSRKEKNIISRLDNEIRERIQIQKDLERREELLANAEKIAHLGSWEFDTLTGSVKWSDEAYNIFGYDPDTVSPSLQLQEQLISPQYREMVKRELSSAIRNNSSYSIEYQIQNENGELKYVLAQGNYVAQEKKLISTLLDITSLHEASLKLTQSEALLREAEAISHNGSWEWFIDSNDFFWSDELFRIHGLLPNHNKIGLEYYKSIIHPEDTSDFFETLNHSKLTHESFSVGYRIIRPNGEIRHLLLTGKYKGANLENSYQVVGNTQDITELKNTSLQLDKSESIYRTIAKNVPDSAVFLFDKKMELLLLEGPAILNIDKENILSKGASLESMFKNDYPRALECYKLALDGKDCRYDKILNGKTFKITYNPVYSTFSKEIFGVMIVMHDITDIKKAQQNLEIKVTELNRSNSELEQFAYVASHDLQEPLRKIRAFGDRLQHKFSKQLPADGIDYINRMQNASERMQILIEDLLTFSRLSTFNEEFKKINLYHTLNGVISDLEIPIEKKKARIEITGEQTIKAIPSQIRQLFQNLISNSLKFTKENSIPEIKIIIEQVKGENFSLEALPLNPEKDYCKIQLSDNGIGFSNEYAGKIFTLFQRLHTRNEYEGTGIGLAVCKKIVGNHAGHIEAKGSEGKGAEFNIFLPLDIDK
ncbi:PAS domain-containing protein [Pedobacter sp. P351]|uniref:PAS domain-containing protein n=1 Tax=Pedobacter superstes TaxID=3133441 RepID=UPI0030AA1F4D